MKPLGRYRIYNIATTHHVCSRNIYSDGKGNIFVARGRWKRYTFHKIDFDKYFVERICIFQDEILNE